MISRIYCRGAIVERNKGSQTSFLHLLHLLRRFVGLLL